MRVVKNILGYSPYYIFLVSIQHNKYPEIYNISFSDNKHINDSNNRDNIDRFIQITANKFCYNE